MHIYLPIAELSANALHLLLLGGIAGLLSGIFGIGGGFILTPMLIFIGIPPAVSVATSTNMIIASSFSGFLSHLKHKRVDIAMGSWLIAGGMLGAGLGVWLFSRLQRLGQIDLMITLLYISLLLTIGVIMLREARQILAARAAGLEHHTVSAITLPGWITRLPWQVEFSRSHVSHSLLLPMAIGLLSGLLVGLLGVGGGFIMLPLMLYVLRMPISVTIGTSLFQIIFITAASTLLHALTTHAVDIVLAGLLLMGSVVGAQYGARFSHKIPTHLLRFMLAGLLLTVAARLAYGLFITPSNIFTLVTDIP
ncbi:MAG: sulfite exporter TauE/SafE family protein [Alphaproteobacteria bacterium]|nr:sulfite exporter TauE/SafE family protein [Alphaproteobacteria bacterium]